MPESTDALCEHIHKTVKMPYDLIVVDNGSDITLPSNHTSVFLHKNKQTTQGFLDGLACADVPTSDYFAYWLLITSAEFIEDDLSDPLEVLLSVLENDPKAFVVQPSIEFDYDQAWSSMLAPRGHKPRRAWGVDYISALFRADHLNEMGRFRKELTMMWGVPGECNWKARKSGLHIYVHDGYTMKKHTDIGYEMLRMGMTAEKRRELASAESDRVLEPIYGENYRDRFGFEYRETKGDY